MDADWTHKLSQAEAMLASCRLCGRACGADRRVEAGQCGLGRDVRVAACLKHFGEEPPISGTAGSGTIFFSGCVLACVFCQNHQISQEGVGRTVSEDNLADMMLSLQNQGAHNINLVSPTPWVPQIVMALFRARQNGLTLPIVYNTGGYDSLAALDLMDGLVDIYLPDIKCGHRGSKGRDICERLYNAANYVAINRAALKAMHAQAGDPVLDEADIAVKGTITRHLVLPGDLSGTVEALEWMVETFGTDVWMSLMAQYLPLHRVLAEPERFPDLARTITEAEYDAVVDAALDLGMENVFIQELTAPEVCLPDFTSSEVFSWEQVDPTGTGR